MVVVEGAAGSAAKMIFGPMITLFTFMYSTWRNIKKEDREIRANLFKDQFIPAFERLEKIHKDYITSFFEFYETAKKFEIPHQDQIAKFRRYRMEYATWREDVRCFT